MTEGSKDGEAFLDRWSRRKLEQAEEKPALSQQAQEKPAPWRKAEAEAPAAPLPPIEGLTPDSDFTPFMAPNVDGTTRRAALKKLFADPHFNVPDPFEAYSEDWTVGEKIPMEILKTLNHAQKLLFDEPEKAVQAAAAPAETPPETPLETPQQEPKDGVGKQDA